MFGKIFIANGLGEENGRTIIVDPVVEHRAPFIPTVANFYLYASIVADEIKPEYQLNIKLFSPSRAVIDLGTGHVANNSVDVTRGIIGLNMSLESIILPEEGEYRLQLIVDNRVLDEYKFIVFNDNLDIGGVWNEQ